MAAIINIFLIYLSASCGQGLSGCTALNFLAEQEAATCTNRSSNPSFTKTPDGCSVPDSLASDVVDKDNPMGDEIASFKSSCDTHDLCYGTCSTDEAFEVSRAVCDDQFESDLTLRCAAAYSSNSTKLEQCNAYALAYVASVREIGSIAYWDNQKNACLCCTR